jgi:RNA polymerase sigma-70 factor (ECF subfamily)
MLFGLAYRMLGIRADAEDAVQEAFLRWLRAPDEEIRLPKAFLTTVVSRVSLDMLKSSAKKREVYVGSWLPEPLIDPPAAKSVEMAESLSFAFVHLLQALSPAERVAFLLREIFDAPYAEIASTLETSEANCRQLVARAAKHIRQRRPRFPVNQQQHREVLSQFLLACASGDPRQLLALLREDVVLRSDGGGKVAAALNPIFGADRVARFFLGIAKKGAIDGIEPRFADVNGEIGALLCHGGLIRSVVVIQLDENHKIADIYLIANPDKLPKDAVPPQALQS